MCKAELLVVNKKPLLYDRVIQYVLDNDDILNQIMYDVFEMLSLNVTLERINDTRKCTFCVSFVFFDPYYLSDDVSV